jgi:hypothetical protein
LKNAKRFFCRLARLLRCGEGEFRRLFALHTIFLTEKCGDAAIFADGKILDVGFSRDWFQARRKKYE